MNRFALLSLYRSLTRHKLYAALNIGGLAVGIAVFLVLSLYVRFETSFERWLPQHDKIYVVQTVWNLPDSPFNGAYPYTMGGLLSQIREDIPGIVGTRIWGGGAAGRVIRGGVGVVEDVAKVDRDFFRVFDLPMVRGSKENALADPASAIISEKVARKFFGSADPIGATLTVALDAPATYRVTGVFRDPPRNTDLQLGILLPLQKTAPSENWYHWGSTQTLTYLRFDTAAAARAFEEKMPAFVNRRGRAHLGVNAWKVQQIKLLPLDRLHLEPEGSQSASRKLTVVTLGLVGVLTLLIAIVNYVNLATARAGLRAREVAMRKVLGGDRAALLRQFLTEAIATVALAALGGLILAEIGLPWVNAAGGSTLEIPYAVVVPALAVLTIIVGVLAGLYPAVLLSRYPAASVLASARTPGGGRSGTRVRETLVVFQFGLATAFVIGTMVLLAQTRHVRETDLGFRRDGLIVVRSLGDDALTAARRRDLMTAIGKLPGVVDTTMANSAPGGTGENNSDNVPLPGVPGDGPSLRWIIVGPRFFEVHGARLIAGRLFDQSRGEDDATVRDQSKGLNIVINRRALSTLHFTSPEKAIGKTVGGKRPRTVIGVVDDLRFGSPREPYGPTYYINYREPEKAGSVAAIVRVAGDPNERLAALGALWRRMAPEVPFVGETADQRMAELYKADENTTRLFAIGAGLAVLIGCVGLWGLASFNTARRIKEIGIRKTLGASSGAIVRLLIGQFLRPVLIANLVAWPLAYVAMRTWLAGFDDRIALSPVYFVAASVLATVIAVLTVLGQSLRASRAAPAWALRHE